MDGFFINVHSSIWKNYIDHYPVSSPSNVEVILEDRLLFCLWLCSFPNVMHNSTRSVSKIDEEKFKFYRGVLGGFLVLSKWHLKQIPGWRLEIIKILFLSILIYNSDVTPNKIWMNCFADLHIFILKCNLQITGQEELSKSVNFEKEE